MYFRRSSYGGWLLTTFFKAIALCVTFFVGVRGAVSNDNIIKVAMLRLVVVAAAINITFNMRVNHGSCSFQ